MFKPSNQENQMTSSPNQKTPSDEFSTDKIPKSERKDKFRDKLTVYEVKGENETLRTIAADQGIPVEDIVAANSDIKVCCFFAIAIVI